MKTTISVLAALFVLAACSRGPVPHGKVGLWNFSLTMHDLNSDIPPAAKALLAGLGTPLPETRTHGGQICMSEAQVKSGALPPINPPDSGCKPNVTKNDAHAVTAEMTCTGAMKGTGHLDISYPDDQHNAGHYTFKGTMGGRPLSINATFTSTWAKDDCGKVRP